MALDLGFKFPKSKAALRSDAENAFEDRSNGGLSSGQADDLLPELNCFFLSGGRHDKDRIEIQIGFDGLVPANSGNFEYDVDCVMFSPRTLGLLDVEDTETLRQEFQSYIRLHSHVTNPASETGLIRVKERLLQLKAKLNMETLRYFAIEVEGLLKGHAKRLKRNRKSLVSLLPEIETVKYLVRDFRGILEARELDNRKSDDYPRGSVDHDLLLLNEYLSHLYVQYFSDVYFLCRQLEGVDEVLRLVRTSLSDEATLRSNYGYLLEQRRGPQSSELEDLYLRRISLLKKYFQSALFVKVKSEDRQQKAFIPVYGIAAALAAAFTIMVTIFQAKSMQERVGINSVAFISFGVVAYVIKDLMKDYFRKYFFKTSSYFMADYRKKLYLVRNGKTQKLGYINEYLRMIDNDKLPKDVRDLRYSVAGGEMESHLNEDIIHFKKRVVLDINALGAQQGFPWGLREIIRYRYDRMLISMEDPFKTVNLISETGIPLSRLGHRVYHTYIFTRISNAKATGGMYPQITPAFKAFQVTLDKSGVLDCKEIKLISV